MNKTKLKVSKKLFVVVALALVALFTVSFGSGFALTASAATADEYSGIHDRSLTYDITSTNPLSNEYDTFDWSVIPLNYRELVANKYDYVTVSVMLYMKEVKNGRQYVYLYPSVTSTSPIASLSNEYNGSILMSDYGVVEFNFKTYYLSDFVQANTLGLTVRYAAGSTTQPWTVRDCRITVTVSKTSKRAQSSVMEYRED